MQKENFQKTFSHTVSLSALHTHRDKFTQDRNLSSIDDLCLYGQSKYFRA